MVKVHNQIRSVAIETRQYQRLAQNVLKSLGQERCEVSITFVPRGQIIDLNRRYLNKDLDTDVISFNLGEAANGKLIGDIYICPEVAQENARVFASSLEDELARLVIHGVLHFAGYEDHTDEEKQHMHNLENNFLEKYWK
ncbi:MAG: rRNA maturation RNase YbeY [Calditrichaeota bacterium]|nr:MAG: rRNA maturation RNase YbeY [Calditrichota bacterium]